MKCKKVLQHYNTTPLSLGRMFIAWNLHHMDTIGGGPDTHVGEFFGGRSLSGPNICRKKLAENQSKKKPTNCCRKNKLGSAKLEKILYK